VNQELYTQLPPRVDIYLYTALEDLENALLLAGRDWQGGQARPDLGVVLVAIAPGQGALAQMKRGIPHELTHLLVFQATGVGYARVPRWLDEGLASANEELAQPEYQLALRRLTARASSSWRRCAPFSTDAGMAQLSYAGASVVSSSATIIPMGFASCRRFYRRRDMHRQVARALGTTECSNFDGGRHTAGRLTLANSVGAWALLAVTVLLCCSACICAASRAGGSRQDGCETVACAATRNCLDSRLEIWTTSFREELNRGRACWDRARPSSTSGFRASVSAPG
jgi:hypothetical protein